LFFFGQEELGYAHPERLVRRDWSIEHHKGREYLGKFVTVLSVAITSGLLCYATITNIQPVEKATAQETATEVAPATESILRETGPVTSVYDLAEYQGNLIATTDQGLLELDSTGWQRLEHPYFTESKAGNYPFWVIGLLETDDNLWIGGSNAVFSMDHNGIHVHRLFPRFVLNNRDMDVYVIRLLKDQDGALCLFTTDGIAKYDQLGLDFYVRGMEDPFYDDFVLFFPPPFWIGNDGFAHYLFYDEEQIIAPQGAIQPAAADGKELTLRSAQGTDWWMVTAADGNQYEIPVFSDQYLNLTGNTGHATFGFHDGQTAVDNHGKLWLYFENAQPQPVLCSENCEMVLNLPAGSTGVVDLYIRTDGRIVVLVSMDEAIGLGVYDRYGNLSNTFTLDSSFSSLVTAAYIDVQDTIWIGTYQDGLWKLDFQNNLAQIQLNP
jgi:ligand-binding sensor domain-containing protein